MTTEKITYFKVLSPYPGDYTKLTSLTGVEIDNNFLTLEGRDIKSIGMEGNFLVITLYNGQKIKGRISGSECCTYDAGEGINPEDFANSIISTNASFITTTDAIVVQGQTISAGTSVEEALGIISSAMGIDVTAVAPSSKIEFPSTFIENKKYEVNTSITGILGESYSEGVFNGKCGYEYSVSANCPPIRTRYYLKKLNLGEEFIGETVGTSSLTYTLADIEEGEYTFSSGTDYNASTVIPYRSDGLPSDVRIPAGSTTRTYKKIYGAYKFYYGYIPRRSDADYQNSVTSESDITGFNYDFCTINGVTILNKVQSLPTNDRTAIALVLPYKYRNIIYTENSFGAQVNVSEKWKYQSSFTTQNNVAYNVYVLHSLLPITYLNIKFKTV